MIEFSPKICILKLDIRPFLAEYSVSADTNFSCIGRSLDKFNLAKSPEIQDVSSKIHESITNQIFKNPREKFITCLLKSVGLKCFLIDFWRYQVLTILLSHGFLEIFEKYMSPKIRENIFQSHGSHGIHGFLEIYPILIRICRLLKFSHIT